MNQDEWSDDEVNSGGNWDSDTLGAIASNLTQLKFFDQAVKELVQNADDAEAKEISFSISDTGITISNNGKEMTHCQFLQENYSRCDYKSNTKNKYCDTHGIKTLSSQNKKNNPDATGKFGIGFVSIFLFTDKPSVASGNLKMTFRPEIGKAPVKLVNEYQQGTILTAPWALHPDSPVRIGLEKPAIELEQVPGIVSDIVESCIKSFIFVRHLEEIKVTLDSSVKLHLTRQKNDNEIIITDKLLNISTSWLLLESSNESTDQLKLLKESNRNFNSRRVDFEILIPRTIDKSFSGLLYATLATSQRTYLPFHINADFFPDTSRNNLPFKDHGNERDPAVLWNRSVISQCAKFVASCIPTIQDLVGNKIVWEILKGSYTIAKNKTGEIVPDCYNEFWAEVKKIARFSRIIENQSGNLCLPDEINLLVPHNKKHELVLNELSIFFQKEIEPVYLEICKEIGCLIINQQAINVPLRKKYTSGILQDFLIMENILDSLYSLIEKTLQSEHSIIGDLQDLPLWSSTENRFMDFASLRKLQNTLDDKVFSDLFPGIYLSSKDFSNYDLLQEQIESITGDKLVSFLNNENHTQEFLNGKLFLENSRLAFDYLFTCISCDNLMDLSKERLRSIKIWPHSTGHYFDLLTSTLPGSFIDPIGVGQLLDREKLGEVASTSLVEHLGVKELSLRVYVLELLPTFFRGNVLDHVQAQKLLIQFVNHQNDFDNEMIQKLKGFPFLLDQDAGIFTPLDCLYPSESLLKVCSKKYFKFVDIALILSLEYVENMKVEDFLRKVGMSFEPNFELLLSSWHKIQEDLENRSSEIKRITDIAEKFLDIWQKKTKVISTTIGDPKTVSLFWPCIHSCSSWHPASELIQSKWSKVVCEQENLHEVGVIFGKKNRELIEEIFAIVFKPPMYRVKEHLSHCVESLKHPGDTFYQFLNWLSKAGDSSEVLQVEFFRDEPLIFQDDEFWVPQDIYIDIPKNLEFLADFVHFVEKAPKGLESLWTTLGIGRITERDVVRYFPDIKEEIGEALVSGVDLSKYLSALSIIGTGFATGESWALEFLGEFRRSEFLLTISGAWVNPEFGIIADNDDWTSSLEHYFASNLVRIEAASYEFLIAAGAHRLTDILEVHEESLIIEGDPDPDLTSNFQERSEEIYSLLANQIIDSPGGSTQIYESAIPRLNKMRGLAINPVAEIQVRVTLSINNNLESREITNAPPLYLSNSNSVIFVRNEKEPILSIFGAILFEFIPRLTSDQIRDAALKYFSIMQMDQKGLMNWLEVNGFLKHDISVPSTPELRPLIINIKNRDENEDFAVDDEETILGAGSSVDVNDNVLAADQDEEEKLDAHIGISLDSDSEPNRDFPEPSSRGSQPAQPSAPPRTSSPNKGNLGDFLKKSTASLPVVANGEDSEDTQPLSLGQNTGFKSRKQNYSGKRRRSGYAHAEAENGDGLASIRNAEVDKAGIEWVIRKEFEIGRKVIDMNETVRKNHEGFDLTSISKSDPEDIRLIEVKSCSGYWPDLGVGLTAKQFEVAIVEGLQSWLYVVENVMEPDPLKRLHRIQNPWANIRSVYFDPGWRDLAEVSPQQNPISLVKGLRVRNLDDGLGWIVSEPTRQGQSIYCRILFDKTSGEKSIRWDDRFFEVVTGDDDSP